MKSKVIYGPRPPHTNTLSLVERFVKGKNVHIVELNGSIRNWRKLIEAVPTSTEVLVLSSFPKKYVGLLFAIVTGGIQTKKKGESIVEISPQVITLCECNPEHFINIGGHSFERRFEFIPIQSAKTLIARIEVDPVEIESFIKALTKKKLGFVHSAGSNAFQVAYTTTGHLSGLLWLFITYEARRKRNKELEF